MQCVNCCCSPAGSGGSQRRATRVSEQPTAPALLPHHLGLLAGHPATAVAQVSPPVSQVSITQQLAAVVASHVPPDLLGPIMAESAVELDMQLPFLDDNVEVLRAVRLPPYLASSGRQAMSAA